MAALSGVARVTVSRVLNSHPSVSAAVRERVLSAVGTLGYKVNLQARALAGGRQQVLALVIASDIDAEPTSFYQSGLELGALRTCAELGYQLLIHAVRRNATDQGARVLDLIDRGRCDGLMLTPPLCDDLDLLRQIAARDFPAICISAGAEARKLASGVRIDDEAAGYEITRYLIGLGHRRFGFMHGLERHLSADERFAGFHRALAEADLGEEAYVAQRGDFTFRAGAERLAGLVGGGRKPTAIICANDDMAIGAMFSAHRLGLAIPRDLSIVGFDDTPVSEICWPPLTTVRHPVKAIGALAVDRLVARIKGAAGREARTDLVAHAIVVRDSAGPPAATMLPER